MALDALNKLSPYPRMPAGFADLDGAMQIIQEEQAKDWQFR